VNYERNKKGVRFFETQCILEDFNSYLDTTSVVYIIHVRMHMHVYMFVRYV